MKRELPADANPEPRPMAGMRISPSDWFDTRITFLSDLWLTHVHVWWWLKESSGEQVLRWSMVLIWPILAAIYVFDFIADGKFGEALFYFGAVNLMAYGIIQGIVAYLASSYLLDFRWRLRHLQIYETDGFEVRFDCDMHPCLPLPRFKYIALIPGVIVFALIQLPWALFVEL